MKKENTSIFVTISRSSCSFFTNKSNTRTMMTFIAIITKDAGSALVSSVGARRVLQINTSKIKMNIKLDIVIPYNNKSKLKLFLNSFKSIRPCYISQNTNNIPSNSSKKLRFISFFISPTLIKMVYRITFF